MITSTKFATDIRPGESIMFFPSFGCQTNGGRGWKIEVCGAIIEPDKIRVHKKLLLRILRRVLKATPEELEGEIYQERIRAFAASTKRGKRVAIRIGSRQFRLQKKTKRNGHFRGTLRLDQDDIEKFQAEGAFRDGCLYFDAVTADNDDRVFSGCAHLLEQTGVSVISDIDDTIKQTGVISRTALLTNTFLREFEPIDGMARLYQTWANHDAAFHYVSSSPWQLFEPLVELCQSEGFPNGTFHLRTFRLRDHMLRRVMIIRRRGKGVPIRSLLQAFPQRRFVLVGDSSERDPEIYASAAKKFPDRIARIFIRDISGRPLSTERKHKVFRGISPDILSVFDEPEEIGDWIPDPNEPIRYSTSVVSDR